MARRGRPAAPLPSGTARGVRTDGADADEDWCVFDDTAAGAGTTDAPALREMLGEG